MEIGIDIGTSYSSVAVLGENGPIPIKSDTGQCSYGNSYSIPSAVFAKKDGTLLIGQAAVASRMIDPSCFRDCFKRDLGTSTAYLLGETEYTPDQLYIEFFKHFRQEAVKRTGEQVTKTYLTHPANYTDYKKQKLRTIASYAGLNDVHLLEEPTAAALSYLEEGTIKVGESLLIYDFGGGTFDLALIRATNRGFEQMTEPLGLEHCGGIDFDLMIYEDIIENLSRENDLSTALTNIKFRSMLIEESIKTKHKLSFDDTATATIPFGFGEFLTYHIDRTRYNQMITHQVMQTCDLIKRISDNAGIKMSEIDRTLCVGGTSRTPYIIDMLEKTVGKSIFQNADPELAICCGAVAYSKISVISPSTKLESEKNHQPDKEMTPPSEAASSQSPVPESDIVSSSFTPSEKRGNTVGNIINGGMFGFSDDWVYYFGDDFKLCKIRSDGRNETILAEVSSSPYINVVDDWIYYAYNSSIKKVRTDGSQKVDLNAKGTFINVVDGWIYYLNPQDNYCLNKMCTDGRQCTKINNDTSLYPNVVNGWIYYRNNDDNGHIYKIKTDGTNRVKVNNDDSQYINVVDGWIYYRNDSDNEYIYKMRTNGSDRVIVKSVMVSSINVVNHWIYYEAQLGKLFKMSIDGSQLTCLKEQGECSSTCFHNDWLYYRYERQNPIRNSFFKNKTLVRRIRTDGTGEQTYN